MKVCLLKPVIQPNLYHTQDRDHSDIPGAIAPSSIVLVNGGKSPLSSSFVPFKAISWRVINIRIGKGSNGPSTCLDLFYERPLCYSPARSRLFFPLRMSRPKERNSSKEVREVLASQYELSARIRLSKRDAYSFYALFLFFFLNSASGLTFFTNVSASFRFRLLECDGAGCAGGEC